MSTCEYIEEIKNIEIKELDIKNIKELPKFEESESFNQITNINLDFKSVGIGALNQQMTEVIRAVLSRAVSKEARDKLGIKGHEKGILLYGPAGTGKTLIARELAGILNVSDDRFKVVNGPELISKYVGESEENIRNLFQQAIRNKTQLYIIFFDEFDSIAAIRSNSGGTAENVGNRIVNQLLTMMDGAKPIDNVLIIAATNRKDIIDPALLRPGRFGVLLKIGLPDEEGRRDIFNIHLKEAINNKALGEYVNINDLAKRTNNFSGAEIKGLCDRARSLALQDALNIDDNIITSHSLTDIDIEHLCIEQKHFDKGLIQINPMFGQKVENFTNYYDIPSQQLLITQIKYKLSIVQNHKPITMMITGKSKSGKSSIARQIAECTKNQYDYTKIISPSMYDFKELLDRTWHEAQSVKKSLIILDGLEHLTKILNQGRYDERVLTTLNQIVNSSIINNVVFMATMDEDSFNLFNIINQTMTWSSIYHTTTLNVNDIHQLMTYLNIKCDLSNLLNDITIGQLLEIININSTDWTEKEWHHHINMLL